MACARRRRVATASVPNSPARPRPRIANPASCDPEPLEVLVEASAADTDGDPAEPKPLHRSPAALRVEGAAFCDADLPFDGADLAKTACPPREVVPAVAPLARWAKSELTPRLTPVEPLPLRVRLTPAAGFWPWAPTLPPVLLAGAWAPLVTAAPLVPVEAAGEGRAFAPIWTGAGAPGPPGVAVGGLGTGEAGVVGGAAGVAGVPKVEGVHAHVRLAPTTVASAANIATEINRVCLRTRTTYPLKSEFCC